MNNMYGLCGHCNNIEDLSQQTGNSHICHECLAVNDFKPVNAFADGFIDDDKNVYDVDGNFVFKINVGASA